MNLLITGASRGLGKEWILQSLKRKEIRKIYAVTRNEKETLDGIPSSELSRIQVIPISVDRDECIPQLQEALKNETLDIVINNAGIYLDEPSQFMNYTTDLFRKTFEVNVYAALRVTQALVPKLLRSKNPRLVHITSLMGSIADNSSSGSYAYRMSKTALNMFHKSFSIEYPQIACVALHPGWVKTDMGGSQAPTTVQESVQGMWKVLDQLTPKNTGKYIDFEGDELPW